MFWPLRANCPCQSSVIAKSRSPCPKWFLWPWGMPFILYDTKLETALLINLKCRIVLIWVPRIKRLFPWLSLPGWYGCGHALSAGQTVGWCTSVSLAFIVVHFRVAFCLQTSACAKLFLWKWVWFLWKWTYRLTVFSELRFRTDSFWNRGTERATRKQPIGFPLLRYMIGLKKTRLTFSYNQK